MKLYGRELTTHELRDYVNTTRGLAGLRQIELQDGTARGVCAVEARTAGGLNFMTMVKRGFDIGDVTFEGLPTSWRGNTGYVAPWF